MRIGRKLLVARRDGHAGAGVDAHGAISIASRYLEGLAGHPLDLLTVLPPKSLQAAIDLATIVSKLSPILGNFIECRAAEVLNQKPEFAGLGQWRRQDPGFPDIVFDGAIVPIPGFEIKAWFPLATEITGRFKDSQSRFASDETHVALVAWMPEHLLDGMPQILDVCVVSALGVAQARDAHYHKPPGYIVIEPGDTRKRTRNLQQTNTAGYKWQGDPSAMLVADRFIATWGPGGRDYSCEAGYQARLVELMGKYKYRLDTNFAKMDRIEHEEIERFKTRTLNRVVHGLTLKKWARVFSRGDVDALRKHFGLK